MRCRAPAWWRDSTLYIALALAGFTIAFGTRHLDTTERHEGMVAAIAFESVVKLLAFLAVGVVRHLGPVRRARRPVRARRGAPRAAAVAGPRRRSRFACGQWFALTLLAMLSVIFLPRQFQMMVVENVDERHLRRAAWAFPLYLLLINLFVLPIALGGLLHFGQRRCDAETFVLSLPLAAGQPGLALAAFIGGLSAATGMVIVEAIAVSTMVCNDLVMPLLLRRGPRRPARDLSGMLLGIRRVRDRALLLLGYLYFRIAGEAYALVSIGLISFAAVAQFAPAMLGGMYWKGGTRAGALAGLGAGFALWAYTLMLPSIAKSGWMPAAFLDEGPFGIALLRPEQLLGLAGLDSLTHSLFWSLLANAGALRRRVALARAVGARGEPGAAVRRRLPARRRRGDAARCSGAAARRWPTCARWPGASSAPTPAQRAVRRLRAAAAASPASPAISRRRATGAVRRDAARRRDRQRLGARGGGLGGRGGAAGPRRRDAHPRRGVAAARLLARAGGEVAVAGARHRRAARRQRAAEEPGPAEGRLHVLGDARAAHAADLDPRIGRADARRPRDGRGTAPAASSASWSPRPSA